MYQKELHIVTGFSGKEILLESNSIAIQKAEIWTFNDILELGPLQPLDVPENVSKRKDWLIKIFGSKDTTESPRDSTFVESDLVQYSTLKRTISKYSTVFLWLGDTTNERITTARLLDELSSFPIPIFKANFSKPTYTHINGGHINPTSLSMMKKEDVIALAPHFEQISETDKIQFASLWKNIQEDSSIVRIVDKEGLYLAGDESFFDEDLLNRLTDQFQKSSMVVAYTLYDLWAKYLFGDVGDVFLFYRLNRLQEIGLVEIVAREGNSEEGKRCFQVRKLA